jgi:hypothetical protein
MIEHIERIAAFSVARACGFGALAAVCMMVGLAGAGDPINAVRAGGLWALLTAAVLFAKAMAAGTKPYKSTELWLLLRPEERPESKVAQQVIGVVLRETFMRFAVQFAILAMGLLAMALLLAFVGFQSRVW